MRRERDEESGRTEILVKNKEKRDKKNIYICSNNEEWREGGEGPISTV